MAEVPENLFKQNSIPNFQGGLVAAAARKGAKEHQEDSWVIFCSEDKSLTASGIFDGHGHLNGLYASNRCIELSWEWFQKDWKEMLTYSDEKWEKVLRQFFLKLHESIREVFVENEEKNRRCTSEMSSIDVGPGKTSSPFSSPDNEDEKGEPPTQHSSVLDIDDEKEEPAANSRTIDDLQPYSKNEKREPESSAERQNIGSVKGQVFEIEIVSSISLQDISESRSLSPVEDGRDGSSGDIRVEEEGSEDSSSDSIREDEKEEDIGATTKNISDTSVNLRTVLSIDIEPELAEPEKPKVPLVDDRGVVRTADGKPIHGGTTASLCIVINTKTSRRCICANVGDSEMLLLPYSRKLLPKVKKNYLHLSVTHGPDNHKEWERIHLLPNDEYPLKLLFVYDTGAAKKEKCDCPRVFQEHGPNAGFKDPDYVKDPWDYDLRPTNARYDPAVYAVSPRGAEDVTCIAMTRTLGDFYAHQLGLTWEPTVYITNLDPEVEYIVSVGSDGIWDCWKYADFSEYVTSTLQMYSNDLLRATTDIVRTTITRAKSLFGLSTFDDASLCLLLVPKSEGN